MKSYWIYAENLDEAGTVVHADSPREALNVALSLGFNPKNAEVWAYELGSLYCLGRVKDEDEEIEAMTLATALSYFSEEAANKKDPYLTKAVQLILDATKGMRE